MITRDRIEGLYIVDYRAEPGLIIGQTVLSYVNVVNAILKLKDGTARTLRLLEKDYNSIVSHFGESAAAAEA